MMMQVLIVENDAKLATILKDIVEIDHMHTVTGIAGDLDGAIASIDSCPPQLALIDIVLEEEDGIQCARRLRIISPLTRMVLISAYPDREFRRQALSATPRSLTWARRSAGAQCFRCS